MHIRETMEADLKDILFIERKAFNSDKEAELAIAMLAE
jgi:hypothetical protein